MRGLVKGANCYVLGLYQNTIVVPRDLCNGHIA